MILVASATTVSWELLARLARGPFDGGAPSA
jgi:hypothetical protein